MAYALPAEVEAYWRARRGERLMPLRSEIDPAGFTAALDHAFILERTGPARTRLRLAGLWLTDAMGMEVRGMPGTSLFEPAARADVAAAIERVFSGPSILRIVLGSASGARGSMVLLPLRSDLGDVSRALGCVGTPARPDLARARLTIAAMEHEPLVPEPAPFELAEEQAPYHPPAAGHLRLVKG